MLHMQGCMWTWPTYMRQACYASCHLHLSPGPGVKGIDHGLKLPKLLVQ